MNCKLSMDLVASSIETIPKSRLEPDSGSSRAVLQAYGLGIQQATHSVGTRYRPLYLVYTNL